MSDSDLADASTFFSGKTVGGPSSKVYLKFKATDDNGVNTSKVRVELWGTKDGETSKVNTYNASAVSGETDYYKVEIDTSKTAKASDNTTLVSAYTNLQYRVIVEDNAGKSSNENYSVIYDNEGPVLSFSYITSTKYYGCVDNTIVGQSRDVANTTITDVYMKIVKDTDTVANTDAESTDGDPAKGWVKITDTTKTNKTNVYGWSVKFTTQTSEQNVYVTSQLNEYLDKIYTPTATEASDKQSNKDEIKKLKFAFYAVDALGNKGAVLEESVDIDPNGDRPNTEIVFPAKDEDATGGSVRLTGTSVTPSYEIGTSTVWIQVDMNYNGTAFNESWETDIQQIITDKGGYSVLGYEIENAYYVKTGMDEATGKVTTGITFYKDSDKSATVTARGIKADLSSTNWVKYINKLDEFKPDTGTRKMAVRVYAISPTGKVSLPETRVFLIDASAPQFENLELVKYQDNTAGTGTVTARQTYEDDMWISGEWWLEGKATDDNKLESVIWTDKDGTSTNITKGASDTDKSWTIHKKVGISTADSFGSVSYILNATEDSDQKKSTRKDIRLNYDNKKPTFSLTNTLDADDNVTNKIRNSNGYFTPTGTAEEKGAQSGIDKIVTFYKRTVSSTNYGIDPIAAKSGTSFNNAYSVTFDSDTGIPFVTNVAATKDTGTLDIKVTTASNIPAFARKGGLVRIDNILYVIDSISGQVISLDKQPPASMSKVDFAVAQVVEEGRVESADADSDSDGLIEKLQNIAGTYDWMAAINSNNIEDGSITAGYVCFDNAGNYTKIEKSTKVINNAPRIAGFRYGTDENGDGSVTGTELKTDLTGLNDAHNGMKDDKPIDDDSMSAGRNVYRGSDYPTKGSSTEPLFTIKGITEIYPEVVGGNGHLKYGYTVKN